MAEVTIFSRCPYPIIGQVDMGKKGRKRDEKKRTLDTNYKLLPGDNIVDEDVWKVLKEDPRIQWRLEKGHLREGKVASLDDMLELTEPVSRRHIRELSAKARTITDRQIFDGKNHADLLKDPFGIAAAKSNKGPVTMAGIEAQIRNLQAQMQVLRND